MNATVLFKPEEEEEMIVRTQNMIWNIQEEVNVDDLVDPSHIRKEPTDYEKSQQATKDQPIKYHTEETKYLVFWFCLLP